MGERTEKAKKKRHLIPRKTGIQRARQQASEASQIIAQTVTMKRSYDDLMRQQQQQQHGKKKKKRHGKRELRPCMFYNYRGCAKPAEDCRASGFEHTEDDATYRKALELAHTPSYSALRPDMRLGKYIAHTRKVAIEQSGGIENEGPAMLDMAAEYDEKPQYYEPEHPEPVYQEPPPTSAPPERRHIQAQRAEAEQEVVVDLTHSGSTSSSSSTARARTRTTTRTQPSLEERRIEELEVRRSVQDWVDEEDRALTEKMNADIKVLKDKMMEITNKYITAERFEELGSDPEYKKLTKEIQDLKERKSRALDLYRARKTREEEEMQKKCFGALERNICASIETETSREQWKHRFDVVKPTTLGPITSTLTPSNTEGLGKLYQSFYEKANKIEKRSGQRVFVCQFCTRSLHGDFNPVHDKTPREPDHLRWVLCRRCLATPYCCGAHREAHRPMHEFSCAIHPAWTVPKHPQSLRPSSKHKFCKEPDVQYTVEDLGLNVKEIVKNHTDALIKVSSLVDPSAITHAESCNCIGCVTKRGNVPARQPIQVSKMTVAEIRGALSDLQAQLRQEITEEEKRLDNPDDESIVRDEADDDADSLPDNLSPEEVDAAVERARAEAAQID